MRLFRVQIRALTPTRFLASGARFDLDELRQHPKHLFKTFRDEFDNLVDGSLFVEQAIATAMVSV